MNTLGKPRRASVAMQALGASILLMLGAQAHGSGKAGEIDACSLLTAAEITRTIGRPVDEGVRKDEGFQQSGSYSSACIWTVQRDGDAPADPNAPMGGRSFVILNAMQWPAGSGLARTFLEAFHEAAENGVIPSTPAARSFGDEALWWGDGLAVRVRDVSFGVSVFTPDRKDKGPGYFEERLAPGILRRLSDQDRA